ncbi:hypothetical protein GCM10007920_46620 [Ciceribacter naphthalenivorans]|uniref:DUF5330 domain-containing protein n=3 Tax=Alphaproteobacteria TaxID=28211 RepID=A0A512HFW7_9HYPH|nr:MULTISPECIES: DUF5330 domain-containing protein [Alphaproteobacteria]GEO84331.1 hypothetical protein RNA01_12630 [Ciceribacter naphthalenivorans]GLR24868.1 hypothetical protein GCM10007920_46620 [Ciceribacter naphthalenivorans]GLT07724.1 hypothetical protein GCM10007926_46620 [Sphingomonas psychrolutea]
MMGLVKTMWFLIKGTFWCAMTLVVLSFFSGRPADEAAGEQRLAMGDAIAVVTDAYQYLSAICTEKPDVCEKGAETLQVLGERAREGALVAYQILDSQLGGSDETTAAHPSLTAEAAPAEAAPATDVVITGTVIPSPRPKTGKGPKPYTPPKS